MTDTPNEQAPATRSEWLALIREAVRLENEAERQRRLGAFVLHPNDPIRQPPSEG